MDNCVGYDFVYVCVDFFFVLEEVGYILYLFEVVDGYVVCVIDYVRYYKDIMVGQNIISIWIGWVVSFFQYQFICQGFCVLMSYLVFKCCWDQNIYFQMLECIVGDSFCVWEIGYLFVFCLLCCECFYVNIGGVKQCCGMILNCYDMGVSVCKQMCGFVVDVIKILNCNVSVFNGDICLMCGFQFVDENVVFCCFFMIQ